MTFVPEGRDDLPCESFLLDVGSHLSGIHTKLTDSLSLLITV